MLFAWVFALAAGIVDACIAEPELAAATPSLAAAGHVHAPPPAAAGGAEAAADAPHHAAPAAGDDPVPCIKSCADEASTLPTLKQASAPSSGLWLVSPPPPLLVSDPQVAGEPVARSDALLRREGIPIPIAFLRLAL